MALPPYCSDQTRGLQNPWPVGSQTKQGNAIRSDGCVCGFEISRRFHETKQFRCSRNPQRRQLRYSIPPGCLGQVGSSFAFEVSSPYFQKPPSCSFNASHSFIAYWYNRIKFSVDTLKLLSRFGTSMAAPYRVLMDSLAHWPTRTSTGKPSLTLPAVVEHGVLRNLRSFASVCGGNHHSALADAVGTGLIWNDTAFMGQDRFRDQQVF